MQNKCLVLCWVVIRIRTMFEKLPFLYTVLLRESKESNILKIDLELVYLSYQIYFIMGKMRDDDVPQIYLIKEMMIRYALFNFYITPFKIPTKNGCCQIKKNIFWRPPSIGYMAPGHQQTSSKCQRIRMSVNVSPPCLIQKIKILEIKKKKVEIQFKINTDLDSNLKNNLESTLLLKEIKCKLKDTTGITQLSASEFFILLTHQQKNVDRSIGKIPSSV